MGTCVGEPPAQCKDPGGAEDDLALVHATKRGDASAFEKLVRKYDRKLLRIAQSVTHNREEAEDAVQEAFFKAYQRLDQFQESAKFSTWLIRIVLNEALMKLRRQRTTREESLDRDFQTDTDTLPTDVADWSPNPQELYSTVEFREILIKCLLKLQPALRVVFVLRDIEELSINETGEALGLSAVAVKARLLRARLQLREGLSRYFKKRDGDHPAVEFSGTRITRRISRDSPQ
ncbi:MAG: sigma-70 family RNA polymerase sigma factor [Terriglobales bacterium]